MFSMFGHCVKGRRMREEKEKECRKRGERVMCKRDGRVCERGVMIDYFAAAFLLTIFGRFNQQSVGLWSRSE